MKERKIGLSFDDGPHAELSLEILKILKKFDAKATHFWITENATQLKKENPEIFDEILNKILENGGEIGYHGPYDFSPSVRSRFFGKYTGKEFAEGYQQLEKITQNEINLFRPHSFQLSPFKALTQELDLTIVYGDLFHYAQADWPAKVQIRRFSGAKPGSVLIFHDGYSLKRERNFVLDVLPRVLDTLVEKGMNLNTVSSVL